MNNLKIAGGVLLALLAVDFFGFMAWALSGQTPGDSFYIGAITTNIIRALFF